MPRTFHSPVNNYNSALTSVFREQSTILSCSWISSTSQPGMPVTRSSLMIREKNALVRMMGIPSSLWSLLAYQCGVICQPSGYVTGSGGPPPARRLHDRDRSRRFKAGKSKPSPEATQRSQRDPVVPLFQARLAYAIVIFREPFAGSEKPIDE